MFRKTFFAYIGNMEFPLFNRDEMAGIIKTRRKDLGLTLEEAGTAANLDPSKISLMDNGKFSGSIKQLERYLSILGLELSVKPKETKLPDFDDLDTFFSEEDA